VLRSLFILVVLSNGADGPAPGPRSLDFYIGGSVDELAAVIGPPENSGDRLVWRLRIPHVVGPRRALPSPTFQGTPQGVTVSPAAGELLPPSVVPLYCYIEVDAGPDGRIRAVDATGPGCRHLGNPPLSVE
jgi:hypothetical protein